MIGGGKDPFIKALSQLAKIDVARRCFILDGIFGVGDSVGDAEGLIRYRDGQFQGRSASGWVSLSAGAGVVSPWSRQGDDIFFNDGNIAIGRTSARDTLDVAGGLIIADTSKDLSGGLRYRKGGFQGRDESGWISFSLEGHSHDVFYFTKAETNSLLEGRAPVSHSHDEQYYTEKETDSLLECRAPVNHSHDKQYYTEAEINSFLNERALKFHSHGEIYYTETEVDNRLSGKADSSHSHDERYFTEDEITTFLTHKAAVIHSHDDRYSTEEKLRTAGKSSIHWGNLTNIPESFPSSPHTHHDQYYTIEEVTSRISTKSDIGHDHTNFYYTKAELQALGQSSIHWGNLIGLPESFTPSFHLHDERYFTENEITLFLSSKSNIEHTHDNRYYTEEELRTVGQSSIHWGNLIDLPESFTPSLHTHDERYFTEDELKTAGQALVHWINISHKPSLFTPAPHIHDDTYFTKVETNHFLSEKSNKSHMHDGLWLLNGDNYYFMGFVSLGHSFPIERLDLYNESGFGAIRLGEHENEVPQIGTVEYTPAFGFRGFHSNGWVSLAGTSAWVELAGNVSRESGFVGLGIPNPSVRFDMYGTTEAGSSSRFRRNDNTAFGIRFFFDKNRGKAIVQDNDEIVNLSFRGFTGSGHSAAAQMIVEVDGIPGISNDIPGRFKFLTTPSGSSNPVVGMMLDSNQRLSLKNGTGINEFTTDETLTENADLAVPTAKAVKKYIDDAIAELLKKLKIVS